MAGQKEIVLGIFPSLGGSIESQRRDGREGLFLNYYVTKYKMYFNETYYFSYANEENSEIRSFTIYPNHSLIHRYLYTFLIPFFNWRQFRACRIFRVMHLNGAIPAILAKIIYGIPFVVTYGYNYVEFAKIEEHPFGFFYRYRYRVTLNTDNRLMSGITLTDEYRLAAEVFGLSLADLERITINAMKSAFVPYKQRVALIYDVIKPGFRNDAPA